MKKSSVLRTTALIAAVGIAAVAAGCSAQDPEPADTGAPVSAEWQAVVDAANEEGAVVWYSSAPPAAREALKAAFEEEYPEITVEIRALNTADMQAALQAEHDTGTAGADVVSNVDYSWIYDRVAEPDFMTPLEAPVFAEQEWVDSGYVLNDKAVIAPIGLVTIGWNTELYPEGIESYDDLLDPKLGNGVIGSVEATLTAVYADWYNFVEENHNPDFVEELAKQDPTFYPSAAVMVEALTAGEVAVGAFTTAADMTRLKDEGAPVDFVLPDPAWLVQNIFYIVESAGHPNAAQVFMNFFGSPKGQAAIAQFGVSPLSEVADQTLGGETPVVLVNIDNMLDQEWVADYQARWSEAFGR
ncbi:ABC transporter substrate-binding protein [Microbacterium immunditiarum]|uniref:Iron(III) transport system substrate-binding protein n=1 Tax=Microbacterium immunditiarum TaxID=337480 RepID=A0A7Y9GLU1_9MICO|nr:extracellular solute-binding protein [Microbacterium immunditiarum]NYE18807.1 iron(III) transport system substrate-binding protein [Microbacterium immunditiarum]